jgi:DNA-binding CsgD family transcriptional regulator
VAQRRDVRARLERDAVRVAEADASRPCSRDGCASTMLVCPTMWPIAVVAVVCFACGRVREYKAAPMILSPLEAARMYKNRGFVTKRGVSHDADTKTCPASDLETLVELIVMGRDAGMNPREIADSTGTTIHYVDNILQLVGENAKCLVAAKEEEKAPRAKRDLSRRPELAGAGLTPREGEVLALVTKKLSNAAIAERLFISPFTVRHHVGRLLAKLRAGSRRELWAPRAEVVQ